MIDSALETIKRGLNTPTPTPVIIGTFALPVVIFHLAQTPDNRPLRIGVWLGAVFCLVWSILGADLGPQNNVRFGNPGIVWIFGPCLHWAFTNSTPQHHPLPRQPLFPSLRQNRYFKSLDLTYNAYRHVNVVGFSPVLRRSPGVGISPWIRAVAYHLFWTVFGLFIYELSSYPIYLVAPATLGSWDCKLAHHDFSAWTREVGAAYGVPALLVRLFFSLCLGIQTHFGMALLWHMFAFFSIASGIWIPEEFPTFTNWPILATSLNDLWSKRWHSLVRGFYLIFTRPFAHLPRPIHVLAIFTLSGVFHVLTYYPLYHHWAAYPYMLFYIGCGVGCIAERAFAKLTGRKVRGVLGWIWTWTLLVLLAQPTVEDQYSTGWVGCMREVFSRQPENSMVVWLLYGLGWGPSPAEIYAARAKGIAI